VKLEARRHWKELSTQGMKVVVSPIIVNKEFFLFPIYVVSCVCIA